MWRTWLAASFSCRYGNQNVYQVLGRDPATRPLRPWEWQLFRRALETHWERENRPVEEAGAVAELPDSFFGGGQDDDEQGDAPPLPRTGT